MAYNRRTSKTIIALKSVAWACENWFWPAVIFLALSPVSPHVLFSESSGSCTYLGSRGFIWVASPENAEACAFITLQSIN